MNARIVNMRNVKPDGIRTIRIDRTTIFGNPIKLGEECPVCGDVHKRAGSTLTCYRVYLYRRVKTDVGFAAQLRLLADDDRVEALACWCAPGPCHGDILTRALEWIRRDEAYFDYPAGWLDEIDLMPR